MRRRSLFALGCAAGALSVFAVRRLVDSRRAPPSPPHVSAALDSVNATFHDTYDAARATEELGGPVLILMGDELHLHRRGGQRVLAARSGEAHVAKSAVHATVGVFVALNGATDQPLPPQVASCLTRIESMTRSSLACRSAPGEDVEPDIRAILELTVAFANGVMAAGGCSRSTLDAFAADAGAIARRLTDYATRLQLAALHRAAEEALASLDGEERRSLQVVVTGDHQARSRSIGMQYFEARFREAAGAEVRVTYAEDAASTDDALKLVGTRRLDRAIAAAFFGDPQRMQRDLLGDAAARILAATELEPIA